MSLNYSMRAHNKKNRRNSIAIVDFIFCGSWLHSAAHTDKYNIVKQTKNTCNKLVDNFLLGVYVLCLPIFRGN